MKRRYKIGTHPHSLANLRPGQGRNCAYEETKKKRNLSVTQTGWDGAVSALEEAGFKSVSDFLEKLGRGEAMIAQVSIKIDED